MVRRHARGIRRIRVGGAEAKSSAVDDARCGTAGGCPWLRHRQDRLPDIGRRRLWNSHFPALGHELSQWLGADDAARPSHSNLRINCGVLDRLGALAYGCGRQRTSRCNGTPWACSGTKTGGSVCCLSDLHGSGAVSGGIHSHQPALFFWPDERAGSERGFDRGGCRVVVAREEQLVTGILCSWELPCAEFLCFGMRMPSRLLVRIATYRDGSISAESSR